MFWYRTSFELCCVENQAGLNLRNCLDKYFYFLLDFENYYSIFLSKGTFQSRKDIMDAVIEFNIYNTIKSKVKRNEKIEELFKDLVKRVNEWNYWKKMLLIQFLKVSIDEEQYINAQKDKIILLSELLNNLETLFDKGIQS